MRPSAWRSAAGRRPASTPTARAIAASRRSGVTPASRSRPDGTRIAQTGFDGRESRLFVLGGGRRDFGPAFAFLRPAWSPNAVSCGTNGRTTKPERDTAYVDRFDGVASDCEIVLPRKRLS